MSATSHEPYFLPHLNREAILRAYEAAAGQEIQSGKMSSPESSSALVANAFGYFVGRATMLPPLPGLEDLPWKVERLCLEHQVRFPWTGGRHPWLDVFAETESHLIGIESKRFEPFRGPHVPSFSDAYWREVWDSGMAPYLSLRDRLNVAGGRYAAIDAAQLVKHALALSAEARRQRKPAVLVYLYTEPSCWPDGAAIPVTSLRAHAQTVRRVSEELAGAAVRFHSLTYRFLLRKWIAADDPKLRHHAAEVARVFGIRLSNMTGTDLASLTLGQE